MSIAWCSSNAPAPSKTVPLSLSVSLSVCVCVCLTVCVCAEVIPILVTTFSKIYAQEFLDDSAVVALSDNIDLQDAINVTQVSWQLPGVPPPTVVSELWREGSLRREAYLNFLSHLYGLPLNAFEATPKLTLKELAGIPPPEPAAAAGPPSSSGDKKSKPKPKGGKGLKPPGPSAVHAPHQTADKESLNRLVDKASKPSGGGD